MNTSCKFMKKENQQSISTEDMIAKGLINVLAIGYRGVEMWREKRTPPSKKNEQDEKKA